MSHHRQNVASPWISHRGVMTGGLFGVGFADASDLLLVATHDGRGVIDCLTGALLARDPDPLFPFDEEHRTAGGIGPLVGHDIQIAGEVYGGTLTEVTSDGWRLSGRLSNSSNDIVKLVPPTEAGGKPSNFTDFVPEIRVFGFSPTGRSFVIGTGAEVFTFAR